MRDVNELRVEIFRAGVRLYRLGAAAEVHPGRLGQMLNGRLPLTPEVEARVQAALKRELAAAGQREAVEA
jgi:hypothetical protein